LARVDSCAVLVNDTQDEHIGGSVSFSHRWVNP
jgi:hypothetical protein